MKQIEKFNFHYKGFTIKVKIYTYLDIWTKKYSNRYKVFGINNTYNNYKQVTDFGLKAAIEECKKDIDEVEQIDFSKYERLDYFISKINTEVILKLTTF